MEETQQSVWNFDGAELYVIFIIKNKTREDLDSWRLEEAYWGIRSLRRELDAKLKRKQKKIIEDFEDEKSDGKKRETEKETVDNLIKGLDNSKKLFNESANDDEEKTRFYTKLEDVYMVLCHIMKVHGLYFREGEDSRLAVLRR